VDVTSNGVGLLPWVTSTCAGVQCSPSASGSTAGHRVYADTLNQFATLLDDTLTAEGGRQLAEVTVPCGTCCVSTAPVIHLTISQLTVCPCDDGETRVISGLNGLHIVPGDDNMCYRNYYRLQNVGNWTVQVHGSPDSADRLCSMPIVDSYHGKFDILVRLYDNGLYDVNIYARQSEELGRAAFGHPFVMDTVARRKGLDLPMENENVPCNEDFHGSGEGGIATVSLPPPLP